MDSNLSQDIETNFQEYPFKGLKDTQLNLSQYITFLETQTEFDLIKHIRRLEKENQLRTELGTVVTKLKGLNGQLLHNVMGPRAMKYCINQIEDALKEANEIVHAME